MFHSDDLHLLAQITGTTTVPEKIETEYVLRRNMLCRAGEGGPLGRHALVDLLRFCGVTPEFAKPKPGRIEFRNLPKNTPVETYRYGDWQSGVYVGPGDNGMICVRMDDDGHVKMISNRPDVLRLAPSRYEAPEAPPAREALLAKVELTDDIPTILESLPAMTDEQRQAQKESFAYGNIAIDQPNFPRAVIAAEAALEHPSEDDTDGFEDTPAPTWNDQPAGRKVWVELDCDYKDGVLVATDDGAPLVLVEGETEARKFAADEVFLA